MAGGANFMKILIIEDNEKLAKYTKQMLEEEGYAVDSAFDGVTGGYSAAQLPEGRLSWGTA